MIVDEEIILFEYKVYINEIESPEEGVIIIYVQNPFETPSFLNEKEKSQRGDLDFDQIIFTDEMDERSQDGQNSNIPSSNEDLNKGPFSQDSLIEAKNQKNSKNPNGALDDNERIDCITDILKESIISLIINIKEKMKLNLEKLNIRIEKQLMKNLLLLLKKKKSNNLNIINTIKNIKN